MSPPATMIAIIGDQGKDHNMNNDEAALTDGGKLAVNVSRG